MRATPSGKRFTKEGYTNNMIMPLGVEWCNSILPGTGYG